MAKSKKQDYPPAPEHVKEKRLILFEEALNTAFHFATDFVKRKFTFSTLGISFLLALEKIGKNDDENGRVYRALGEKSNIASSFSMADFLIQNLGLLGNIFFVVTICITLYECKTAVIYNRWIAKFYYYYDDTEMPEAQGEKGKILKFSEKLKNLELFSNISFVSGIICAIIFVALN